MLKLEHIAKTFNPGTINEKHAIRDLSLELADGDFVTVIGGNGAGKSTLFKLLTRLYEPKSGAIRFGGDNIADFALTGWRDRFAYVFQKDPPPSAARCARISPTVWTARSAKRS